MEKMQRNRVNNPSEMMNEINNTPKEKERKKKSQCMSQ